MRSDLIYGALAHLTNRYELCLLAAKATRKLHNPTVRLQDTTNDVLLRFRSASPVAASHSAGPQSTESQSATVQQRRAA